MIAPRRLAALLVALAACGGSEAKPAGSDDGMVAAWKAAKLDVSALTTVDAKPYGALRKWARNFYDEPPLLV